MEELSKIRQAMTAEEDKDRRYVLELLEEKKGLLRETEELRCQLTSQRASNKEMVARCKLMKDQRKSLED